ncbi:hypothetical protein [Mycobacterium sp. C31M]
MSVALLVLVTAGCGSPTIVDTGTPWTPTQAASPAPELPPHNGNRQLADAAEFYVPAPGRNAYRFAGPSGRWYCAIIPHISASCRPAASATLSITGAPTAVPGPDGESTAPDTVLIDRDSDVRFLATAPEIDAETDPDPPVTLPFGQVLAVAGFRCNVQEASGISCGSETSAKGFTFSADGYTPVYTDVPR